MLSNWPLVILALCVLALGATLAFTNRSRPDGIAHNFGLIVMVNGIVMTAGICLFFFISLFIYGIRGH